MEEPNDRKFLLTYSSSRARGVRYIKDITGTKMSFDCCIFDSLTKNCLKCFSMDVKITPLALLLFNHVTVTVNPLLDDKILDWSKLKQIADDILKCI